MKTPSKYIFLGLLPLAIACNQSTGDSSSKLKSTDVLKEECYTAIDSLDTAKMKLNYLRNGDVTGSLVIDYTDKGSNDGALKGKFRGDTLFIDYTFKIGKNPVTYKNPLALLKSNGKLILGVGQIETTLGKSYFVRNQPIDYRQVKFIFGASECAKVKP